MRVAIISPVYPPYKGGIGAVAQNHARLLRNLGVEVTVFTPRYESRERETGVERLHQVFSLGNAAVTPSLLWRLKGFDLIHVHYPCYGMDLFVALGGLFSGTPVVMTYHMKAYSTDWRNIIFQIHRCVIEPLIFRLTKRVFVSTLDYASSVKVQHRNLRELPFGIDVSRFVPGRNLALREQLGMKEDTLGVVFVGGLDKAHYFKGLDVLLRAAATLPRTQPYKFLIVGDGNERPRFEQVAKDLGVMELVHFFGDGSEIGLSHIYQAADVHVLPSLDQGEAFGLVTLEAGASGLPSIVSNLPGMRMLVDPERTGYRIPAGDARTLAKKLQELFENPRERKAMGLAARLRVEDLYDERGVAEQLFQAYKSLTL